MKQLYGNELPRWLRMLGAWRQNHNSVEFSWGYFAPRFGLEFLIHGGHYFDSQYRLSFCLGWGMFSIKLPFHVKNYQESCEWNKYGIQFYEDLLWLRTGKGTKTWYLPWKYWVFEGHWIANREGDWRKIEKHEHSWEVKENEGHCETHNYTYTLKSGEVQKRKAKCYLEKRQWHRKWFPFVKMERVCIDVEFDGEVGERSGSWKGGTIGCGYDKHPTEGIEQCLRRMKAERRFT